jgi:hypothetical protein
VRRIPSKNVEEINRQVDQMLDNDIVRPSESPFNSNPILTTKKDNSKRFVVDYRKLNDITIPDTYPMPNVDDLIENCKGCRYFSQLDMAAGYWCVPIREKDKHKTAFTVPRGKFEFQRMPFGLRNSGSTFQRKMDNVLNQVKREGYKGVDAYSDNVLIATKTLDEHYRTLNRVLEAMDENNMTVRADK